MNFLKAEWKNLALFNYEVDTEILEKYLPAGTQIDIWNNKCYVSLVGFMFKKTRLFGVPIPFFGSFEEINLRFEGSFTGLEIASKEMRVLFLGLDASGKTSAL